METPIVPPIEIKTSQPRDKGGRFAPGKEPPLVSVTVTNPLTYFKLWLQKILNNEGMDLHLRIRPLTMIVIALIFAIGGFGLGRITLLSQLSKTPLGKYVSFEENTAPLVKDTAYVGILRQSASGNYYIELPSGETVFLVLTTNTQVLDTLNQKILVTGKLNTQSGMMSVEEVTPMQ